jgi:hypothetical protein
MARCPAHDDREPSLAIEREEDGIEQNFPAHFRSSEADIGAARNVGGQS